MLSEVSSPEESISPNDGPKNSLPEAPLAGQNSSIR